MKTPRRTETSSSSDSIAIRALERGDLRTVAAIHLKAFPHSALGKLGHETVRRYYDWQLTGPHDVVAIGAFSGDLLVGFCFGGVFRGAASGFIRTNRGFLAGRLLRQPWLLGDPLFRNRAKTGARALGGSARRSVGPAENNTFGILSIAVDPLDLRSGVGRMLMGEMERDAQKRGAVMMHLTVAVSNVSAIRFYESLGWKITKQSRGRCAMVKSL